MVHAFSRDPELVELTVLALRLVLLTLWIAAPQIMAVSTLQGMGLGWRSMVLALTRQILSLMPALLLLTSLYAVAGAFAAQPVSDVFSLVVTGAYVLHVRSRYCEEPRAASDAPKSAVQTD